MNTDDDVRIVSDSDGERYAASKSTMQDDPADERVSEIQQSIEHTRAEMTGTIDEIQDRLNPAHLKEQVIEQVREQYEQVKESVREATIGKVEDMVERVGLTVNETGRSIFQTIRANPVPTALVGVGLAWMWINATKGNGRFARHSRDAFGDYDPRWHRYDETGGLEGTGFREQSVNAVRDVASSAAGTIADQAHHIREAAENLADKTKAKVGHALTRGQETAGHLADEAQHQVRRAGDRIQTAMWEAPLAIGAMALAFGAGIALAIPQTQKENEWMGEARDTLVDKAQSAATEALHQAEQVAERVTDDLVGPEQGRTAKYQG